VSVLERIQAALPLPTEEGANHRARSAMIAEVATHLREVLAALPCDSMRADALIATAICPDCGLSNAAMYERRGWWVCICVDRRDT
jgi:hypothetical protein